MKNKIVKFMYIVFLISVLLVQYSLANSEEIGKTKYAWGFKRGENYTQPNLDSKPLEILEKYEGLSMGNKESNKIYLTFDAGYEAGYTEKILEVLQKNNVKASFFITAHYLNTATTLVQKMIDQGHDIGNHTSNHKDITTLTEESLKEEIMNLHTAVYEKTGYEMKFFRPPKGEFNEYSIKFAKELGYTSVLWSNTYDDWNTSNQGRSEYGKNKLLDNLHNGSIILLHSTSEDNMILLEDFIKEARNLRF